MEKNIRFFVSDDKPFSVREGISPEKLLQTDSLDENTKTGLWNVFYETFLTTQALENQTTGNYKHHVAPSSKFGNYWKFCWTDFLIKNVENLRYSRSDIEANFRNTFFDSSKWYWCLDLIEHLLKNHDTPPDTYSNFENRINKIFEKEKAEYRLIEKHFGKITSKQEVKEIKEALSNPLESVRLHTSKALEFYSDRNNPDYQNTVKEAISAVEALCKVIVNQPNATLGQALEQIQTSGLVNMHEDMKEAFKKLYSYTNDADGVRHSSYDGKVSVEPEDARYMLVACSAFVNYLTIKANKAGINLS